MFVPIDQRKWSDTLAIDYVHKRPYACWVSKTMTRTHREDGRAMEWILLLQMLCQDFLNAPGWTSIECVDNLLNGSDKNSSTTCVPSKVTLENEVDPHYCWMAWKFRSCRVSFFSRWYIHMFHSGLIAEGKIDKRRETNRYSSPPLILWATHKKKHTTTCWNREK